MPVSSSAAAPFPSSFVRESTTIVLLEHPRSPCALPRISSSSESCLPPSTLVDRRRSSQPRHFCLSLVKPKTPSSSPSSAASPRHLAVLASTSASRQPDCSLSLSFSVLGKGTRVADENRKNPRGLSAQALTQVNS
jgi:hypothetical protein